MALEVTLRSRIVEFSIRRPRLVSGVMVLVTLVLAALAALPSLAPRTFTMLNAVKVDTDPENMLRADEPQRLFHNRMKEAMSLHDMVVLGVVNEDHRDGVFNVASLGRVYELTEFAKTLQWPDKDDPEKTAGVIQVDLLAPSTVDNIEQAGPGAIRFEWLMQSPPRTDEEALAVRDRAMCIPFLKDTLVSRCERRSKSAAGVGPKVQHLCHVYPVA